jgi:ribosomal protein S18 acetylase RimI-like enzyme
MLLLYELDVAPESRRRGVGTALVEEMKGIAARQGCAEMWLVTEDDNDAALATYGATGGKWSDGADRVVAWELSPQD